MGISVPIDIMTPKIEKRKHFFKFRSHALGTLKYQSCNLNTFKKTRSPLMI